MTWAQTASAQSAAPGPKPAIVLPDPRDAAEWQKWAGELNWQVFAPPIEPKVDADTRALNLAAAVRAAIKSSTLDPAHVYLAGRVDETPLVFYMVSREPDLWAGAIAFGGSPKAALNSGRIFGANFTNTPVLWVSDGPGDAELGSRLKSSGLNVEWRDAKTLSIGGAFEELLRHAHSDFPPVADCETNTERFASCYWIGPSKFDAGERNDALPNSRVLDGSGASLDLGGFGYRLTDPGPGALISYLPKDYVGPLHTGDRIVELDGQAIADARDFDARLNRIYTEKPVVVMVQHGKEQLRLDTRVVPPRPDAFVTARVRGRYDAGAKRVEIVSRSITEMRVTIPEQWVPSDLFWDGLEMEKLDKPGCYLLTVDKELLNAAPCSR